MVKFTHTVINFYGPRTRPKLQLSDNLAIFQKSLIFSILLLLEPKWQSAVMYIMARSRLHTHYLWLPEPDQNMPYLSPYHQPILNSAKILWKHRNSLVTLGGGLVCMGAIKYNTALFCKSLFASKFVIRNLHNSLEHVLGVQVDNKILLIIILNFVIIF